MMSSRIVAALCCAALTAITGSASAAGGVVESSPLPSKAREVLVLEVQKARAAKPKAFAAVLRVRSRIAELDRSRRGRLAPVSALLRGLGRDALLPMLEMIALEATPRQGLTDSAWLALRAGLIEAAGSHRDPRSEPVLTAILDGPETEYFIVRAAAEALGRLGTDTAAAKLVALAGSPSPKRRAVVAGMGDCRRAVIASFLAELLASRPDADTAELVVRSLGRVGNAWAWRTPAVSSRRDEEAVTRAKAASALISGFVVYEGKVRRAAATAMLIVDDASTPALIRAERARAGAATAAELDRLLARFERNATR